MQADEKARIEHLRDRKPLLGAVSPGKGGKYTVYF